MRSGSRPCCVELLACRAVCQSLLPTVCLLAPPALAEPPPVPRVAITACPGLDSTEVSDLIELELSSHMDLPVRLSELVLAVDCASGEASIRLLDERNDEMLARVVQLPVSDRARLVALAATELVLAVRWIPAGKGAAPAPVGVVHPMGAPGALTPGAPSPVRERDSHAEPAAGFGLGLGLGYELAVRAVDDPEPISQLVASASVEFTVPLEIGLRGGFGFGGGELPLGEAAVTTWFLGGSLGSSLPLARRLSLHGGVGVSLDHFRVVGTATERHVTATSVAGFAPDIEVHVGPRFRLLDARSHGGAIELLGRFGFVPGEVRASTSEGDASVTLDGFWCALALSVRYETALGEKSRRTQGEQEAVGSTSLP